jgi:hypothetical protein
MDRVPEFTESDVQIWVGAKSFQKGYRYYEDETILNPRRRGQSLIAECQGSKSTPYRVEIQLSSDGILSGSCTCTAGEGGRCKHAAALLLTWLHEPQIFVEVPDLNQLLNNRSKAELISFIQQMVARYPDLEQLLELSALNNLAPGQPLPPDLIAQQVHRAFSSAGSEGKSDNAQIADNLQPILDLGEDLLDRKDVANAATVYQTLMDCMLAYEECLYDDPVGDLGQVLAECEQGVEDCLTSASESNLRLELLRSLFELFTWDLQAGKLGFADETPAILAKQTTLAEKQQIVDWIQSALADRSTSQDGHQRRALGGLWLDVLAEEIDDETYLQICRETSRIQDLINRLLDLEQVDQALVEARNATDSHLTVIADLFEAHGYAELAEQFVQEQPNHAVDEELLEWQKQYAVRHNRPQEALQIAESLFWQAQSAENYYALLDAADALHLREATRERALERLENAGNFPLLVEIYLLENEVDLALAALERVKPDIWGDRIAVLRRQVAEAVEIPRPHEAIRQYLLLSEALIEQRGRGNYAEATRLLQQVQKLLLGLGETERWKQTISTLRENYRRMPALLDEMQRAGLI